MHKTPCSNCEGTRLKPISRQFKIGDKNISQLGSMDFNALQKWFDNIEDTLTERQKTIAREPLKEIRARIGFMLNVGLGYLSFRSPSSIPFRWEKDKG